MDIPMTPCESTHVESYGYDPASQTLAVQYKGRGLYHYHGVRPSLYESLREAKSVGRFLGQHIYGEHSFTRLDEPEEKAEG